MVKSPIPAVAGSNSPVTGFTPVPDQTPPGVAAVNVAIPSVTQKGPAKVMLASGVSFTTISIVLVSVQPPMIMVYVIVCVPGPAVAGSNVPASTSVIPAPLHVPPGVTAVKVIAPSTVHKGPAGVIVA